MTIANLASIAALSPAPSEGTVEFAEDVDGCSAPRGEALIKRDDETICVIYS